MVQTRRKLGSSLPDALSLSQSQNQRALRRTIATQTQRIGLDPTGLFSAVCQYPGGGQNVVGLATKQEIPPDVLTYYAAWTGLLHDSPSVLTFSQGAGGDTLAIFELGPTDPALVASVLDASGAPGRWVLPSPQGLRAMVLVRGADGQGAVQWLSRLAQATPLLLQGSAIIIGSSTNAGGRAAYRKLIATAEGTDDRPADGSGPVHAPSGGATYRGIYYPGGQVIPSQGA